MAKLTKAARYLVRSQRLLEQAREAIAPDVEAYQQEHPFQMTGLNQADYTLENIMGSLGSVEKELRERGLWDK